MVQIEYLEKLNEEIDEIINNEFNKYAEKKWIRM